MTIGPLTGTPREVARSLVTRGRLATIWPPLIAIGYAYRLREIRELRRHVRRGNPQPWMAFFDAAMQAPFES